MSAVGSDRMSMMGMLDGWLNSGSGVGLVKSSSAAHGQACLGPLLEAGVIKDVAQAIRVVSEECQIYEIPRVVLEGTHLLFQEEKECLQ